MTQTISEVFCSKIYSWSKVLVLISLFIYYIVLEYIHRLSANIQKYKVYQAIVFGRNYVVFKCKETKKWIVHKITGSDVIIHGKKFGKNKMSITYNLGDDSYEIIISTKRMPCKISKAICDGQDITSRIIKLAGPHGDFHGKKYTHTEIGLHHPIIITDNSGTEIQI